MNAVGRTIPPVLIFPGIRNVSEFLEDAPTSSIALGNKSEWMTSDLFIKDLGHIVLHTNCSVEKKIINY